MWEVLVLAEANLSVPLAVMLELRVPVREGVPLELELAQALLLPQALTAGLREADAVPEALPLVLPLPASEAGALRVRVTVGVPDGAPGVAVPPPPVDPVADTVPLEVA